MNKTQYFILIGGILFLLLSTYFQVIYLFDTTPEKEYQNYKNRIKDIRVRREIWEDEVLVKSCDNKCSDMDLNYGYFDLHRDKIMCFCTNENDEIKQFLIGVDIDLYNEWIWLWETNEIK